MMNTLYIIFFSEKSIPDEAPTARKEDTTWFWMVGLYKKCPSGKDFAANKDFVIGNLIHCQFCSCIVETAS